jgi:hypothetical protein
VKTRGLVLVAAMIAAAWSAKLHFTGRRHHPVPVPEWWNEAKRAYDAYRGF